MRLPLLLLLLFGISCAAPITINYEAAARRFYASFKGNYTAMKNGEVVDLVFEQFEKFFPGFISADDKKVIRTAFIDYRDKEDNENPPSFTVDPAIVERAKTEFNKRMEKLDSNAKSFMNQVIKYMSVGGLFNASLVSAKFTSLRTMYDPNKWEVRRLTPSGKLSLAGQFEIFNRLDEAQALITVGEILWDVVNTGCRDVPEFWQCKKLKKKGLITYEEASSNHEGAAKKFYSQFANAFMDPGLAYAERLDAAYNLLWEKFYKFFPELVSAEDKISIKATFIKYNEDEDWARQLGSKTRPPLDFDPKIEKRFKEELEKRFLKLNGDARIFVEKALLELGADDGPLTLAHFAYARILYDETSASVKSSLAGQFEFFNHLEEFEALVVVGDRLMTNGIFMCENLSESGQCGQTK